MQSPTLLLTKSTAAKDTGTAGGAHLRSKQRHPTGRALKNRYNGRPQLTPMQNVAGNAKSAAQLRRTATSDRIQTVSVTAAIVRSQTRPDPAAFTCQASTIALRLQPSARNHVTNQYIGCTAPQTASANHTQRNTRYSPALTLTGP